MRQQLDGDDGVVTLNPRKRRVAPIPVAPLPTKAAKRRVAPIPIAQLHTTKPRRKKRRYRAASAGDAVLGYLQGDEFAGRAQAMDAADSSLAW